jgi:hypothetical protein
LFIFWKNKRKIRRNIISTIVNKENLFDCNINNNKEKVENEFNEKKEDNNYIRKFNTYCDKKYFEKYLKSTIFQEEKNENIFYSIPPFYLLEGLSRIPGFLNMIKENLNKWKDIFYRNKTFEKFYEINFFEEYNKIHNIDLIVNSIKINFLENKDINNENDLISEKENDIELNNIKIISKESFSFNKPNFVPIILTEKSKKNFYPTHFYIRQPKEEENSNVKSALFLSGNGNFNLINKEEIDNLIKKIKNLEDYSKIENEKFTYLGFLEFDKIKKLDYKELKAENFKVCDFVIIILIKNFENEIILTTGSFGIFGVFEESNLEYVSSIDYKYLRDKFLLEEL